jgi:predicted transposase/invertase (TIGR01784 family)
LRQNKTKDIREVMMSLAPAYEKWLKETLDQGRQEGQVEVALRLLQRNMAIAEVAECTGLSISQVEGFANAQVKKLRP